MAVSVPGRHLLAAEVEKRGGNKAAAARDLSVALPSFLEWLSGDSRPSHWRRPRIERWSDGRVPVSSWDTEQERLEMSEEVAP